jgi:hypothetical protein
MNVTLERRLNVKGELKWKLEQNSDSAVISLVDKDTKELVAFVLTIDHEVYRHSNIDLSRYEHKLKLDTWKCPVTRSASDLLLQKDTQNEHTDRKTSTDED